MSFRDKENSGRYHLPFYDLIDVLFYSIAKRVDMTKVLVFIVRVLVAKILVVRVLVAKVLVVRVLVVRVLVANILVVRVLVAKY